MHKMFAIMLILALLALAACTPAAPTATETPEPAETPAAAEAAEGIEAPEEVPAADTAPPAEPSGYPMTVTDMLGRNVTIEREPKVIVSLTAANTEMLFALGLGAKIAAVDSYSDYPAQALELPKVGDYAGVNIEAVYALSPDVVFAGDKLQREAIDKLEELGIAVVATEATAFDQIPASIILTASAAGADPSRLLAALDAARELVAAIVADKPQPTVYYAVSFGEAGDYTVGQGSFINDIIALAGGMNIAADLPTPWPSFSIEQIMQSDPDIIIVGGDEELAAQFCAAEQYKALKAVAAGNVFPLDANTISRPGPRIADALIEMARLLHTDAF